jgi:pimeloyl-ACP methyl ester carboxylesterase
MLPQHRRVSFRGALGHELAARLDLPAVQPVAFALFAHCFTCTKDLKAVGWISRELVARRIALLRFDFTGLGESAGDFADTNFTSNLDDLVAAAGFLRAEYRAPQILIGHSLGGTAALVAARRIPEIVAVATLAAPSETRHLREFLTEQAPNLADDEAARVDIMGRPVTIKGQLLDDLRKYDILRAVAQLNRPLLVFHSPADDIVSIDHARRIFDAAQHPKSFISLDGADHLLLARESDARFVAEVLATWASRYLPPVPTPDEKT